jgi:hypothetical protein
MFRVLLKDAGVPSNGTKGLPPRTDIVSVVGHVRKVPPKADINSRLRRPFGGTGLPVHQVSFHVRLRKDC